jgi:hypothetical protein
MPLTLGGAAAIDPRITVNGQERTSALGIRWPIAQDPLVART